MADLVFKPSGGHNLVFQPGGAPSYYTPATTTAAYVEVYWRYDDELPADNRLIGTYLPGQSGSFPYNPALDKNVIISTISYSASKTPDVSSHDDALSATVIFNRNSVSVAAIDAHVPTVTLAPTITKAGETIDEWIVITPAPDAYGATVKYGEIWVEKADDATVHESWGLSLSKQERIPQKSYPCKIKYRWFNQSSEDIGNGPGWSAWSPYTNAAEAGAATPPAPVADVISTITFDTHGSLAAAVRGNVTV